jgi:hypothetical protein
MGIFLVVSVSDRLVRYVHWFEGSRKVICSIGTALNRSQHKSPIQVEIKILGNASSLIY